MKNESMIRIKIAQLLRDQVEINPEPAIAAMEKGDYHPACRIMELTMNDLARKAKFWAAYSNRVTEVMADLHEASKS